MNEALVVIPAALALDALAGDPQGWPHPVRWMGRAIERCEPVCRRLPVGPAAAGLLMALGLILSTWMLSLMACRVLDSVHPVAGGLGRVVLLATCLSARSLAEHAMAVYARLTADDLDGARRRVGMIVGRDTRALDRNGISRAAVESVAENFVDGVLSPLFFAAIGGVPMALAYKMVNTLDSMIGYQNDRYRYFGRAAARIDDAANYLPARLSVGMITAAAGLLGADMRRAWRTARTDGRRHTSPNAGYPEAAFSGVLDVALGGPGIYHGRWTEKPVIGRGRPAARPEHIPMACELMAVATLVAMAAAVPTAVILW